MTALTTRLKKLHPRNSLIAQIRPPSADFQMRFEGVPGEFSQHDFGQVDVRFLDGKDVFVAGAGNSTGQGVVHLARSARSVTLLVRGDSLEKHMSDYLVREIRTRPNVEVRLRTEAVEGHGDGRLERLTFADRERGVRETRPASALFVLIGAQPHTEWLADAVQRDAGGFIVTGANVNPDAADGPLDRPLTRFETSMPGVFAAGDVRSGSAKRVGSAVGEGAVAMPFIHEYLRAPVSLGGGVAVGPGGEREIA